MDMIDLREEYEASGEFAHLKVGPVRYVPGRGSLNPIAMVLGEAPGATENLRGKPFVGRSGRILDQLLGLAGLRAEPEYENVPTGEPAQEVTPANVFITNTVKYRPPGNRTPTEHEIEKSLKWVRKEWKILGRPPIIVTVGAVALRCIVSAKYGTIATLAGEPIPIAAGGPTVWPMFHPAYALYNPGIRPTCELHWTNLGNWLRERRAI